MTVTELAKSVGVTRKRMHEWKRLGCTATTPEGVQEWRARNVRPQIGGRGNSKPMDADEGSLQQQLLAAQVAKTQEEFRQKQLKNDQTEGNLLDREDVERNQSALCLRIKHRLEAMPDELESEWPPAMRDEIKERMREKIYLVLLEMSNWQME